MGRETDNWPFVKAKYFTPVPLHSPRKVRVIVVHDMEFPERLTAAEDVAHYFATLNEKDAHGHPIQKSAHVCVDTNSVVQCVHDRDVAYAAPGCNGDGIQIELAGYIRQTRDQWLDEYGQGLFNVAANVIAQYLVKFDLLPVHLTDEQLANGDRGIVGHDQVSRVYKRSTHTDPGPNFPWDILIEKVGPLYAKRLNPLA